MSSFLTFGYDGLNVSGVCKKFLINRNFLNFLNFEDLGLQESEFREFGTLRIWHLEN